MNDFGKRLIELRKQKGLSQTELAKQIGVSYIQIGRYETKGTQPPAEVLNKLANAFNTSIDYLINGNSNEKALNTLKDNELLQQFKAVEQMNDDDRHIVQKLIGAFITQGKLKQMVL